MASIGNITASADGSQSPTQAPASGLFATLKNMAASVAPSLVSPTCDDAAAAAAAKSSPGTEQAAARMEGEGGGSKASAPAAGGADGAAEGGGILAAATEKLSTVIEAVAPGWVTGAPGADDDGEQPSSQQKPKSASKEQAAKPKAAAEDAAPIGGNGTMLERASEVASTIGATAAAKLSGAVEAVETAVAGTTQAVKAALPEAIVGAPTPEDEAAAKAAKKKAKKQRQRERKAAAGETGKEEEEEADSGDSSDASSSEEDEAGKERHGHPLKATKVGGRRMALRKQLSGENLPLAEMQAEKAAAAQQAVVFDQIHGASHSRAHQHGIVNDSKRLPAQYAPKHAQLPPPKHNTVARSDFAQRGTTHQTGAQMRSAAGNAH